MGEALNNFLRHSESLGSASFFAFLLVTLLLIGLWSGVGRLPLADLVKGPSARQLFLAVPMRLSAPADAKSGARAFTAHVTDLNAQRMTFISPVALVKGAKVAMDLNGLPDFPDVPGSFLATVSHAAKVKGKERFRVEAQFEPLALAFKAPLVSYLKRMAPG